MLKILRKIILTHCSQQRAFLDHKLSLHIFVVVVVVVVVVFVFVGAIVFRKA